MRKAVTRKGIINIKQKKIIQLSLKYKYQLLILAIWLFHVIFSYIWVKIDNYPLLLESWNYFIDSLNYHEYLTSISIDSIKLIIIEGGFRPPLVGLMATPFYTIFGKSPDVAILSHLSIFLFILLFSIYGIGKKLFNKKVGLLSAFIVSMCPYILIQYRSEFRVDFSLMAMVALCVYTLLNTDYFSSRKRSVIFGITFGLGMLTKITFPFYVLIPSIFILIYGIKNKKVENIILIKNLLSSVAITISIASIWYIANIQYFFNYYIERRAYAILEGAPNWWTLEGALFYAKSFLEIIGPVLSFLLVLAIIYKIIKINENKTKSNFLIICTIIGIYLLVTILIPAKSPQYIFPIVTFLILIISDFILSIKPQKVRLIILNLLIFFLISQYYLISFETKIMPNDSKLGTINYNNGTILIGTYLGNQPIFPMEFIPIREFLEIRGYKDKWINENRNILLKKFIGKQILSSTFYERFMGNSGLIDDPKGAIKLIHNNKKLSELFDDFSWFEFEKSEDFKYFKEDRSTKNIPSIYGWPFLSYPKQIDWKSKEIINSINPKEGTRIYILQNPHEIWGPLFYIPKINKINAFPFLPTSANYTNDYEYVLDKTNFEGNHQISQLLNNDEEYLERLVEVCRVEKDLKKDVLEENIQMNPYLHCRIHNHIIISSKMKKAKELFYKDKHNFKLINKIEIPDSGYNCISTTNCGNATLFIYQRKN